MSLSELDQATVRASAIHTLQQMHGEEEVGSWSEDQLNERVQVIVDFSTKMEPTALSQQLADFRTKHPELDYGEG